MAVQTWGGASSGGSFSAGTLYSDGIVPTTSQVMDNGASGIIVFALLAYVGGNGGARAGSIQLGATGTAAFSLPSQASDVSSGWRACTNWYVQGGSYRFQWSGPASGSSFFGHAGGGTTFGPAGFSRAGTLGGGLQYVYAPTAPTSLSLSSPGVGQIGVSFSAPASNGETGITGYRIKYWSTDAPGTVYTSDVAGSTTISGLALGKTWMVQVAAKNGVTASAGTTGVYNTAAAIFLPSAGKVYNGTSFVLSNPKVWNGTTWVSATIRVWNGTAWVNAI